MLHLTFDVWCGTRMIPAVQENSGTSGASFVGGHAQPWLIPSSGSPNQQAKLVSDCRYGVYHMLVSALPSIAPRLDMLRNGTMEAVSIMFSESRAQVPLLGRSAQKYGMARQSMASNISKRSLCEPSRASLITKSGLLLTLGSASTAQMQPRTLNLAHAQSRRLSFAYKHKDESTASCSSTPATISLGKFCRALRSSLQRFIGLSFQRA